MKTILTNIRRIIKENQVEQCSIVIEDGIIVDILPKNKQSGDSGDIIDLKGALVTPGLIDLHVHLREPGFTHKETVKSGTEAAARGGFTTICAMPNTNPSPDTVERIRAFNEIVKKDALIKVYPCAPITHGLRSTDLVDQAELIHEGAIAFTNDGVGVQDAFTMFEAMKQAANNNAIIAAHAEDDSLKYRGVIHEGKASTRLHMPGIPSVCESSQVARDLLLAESAGCRYHVCHVSAKETLRVIRDAKKAGIRVSCEVTPHHLLLNDENILIDDANFKMNPPLRDVSDQKALLEGLIDGTIDCIASDHAPHTIEDKSSGLLTAPFGIIGLEYGFALLYTKFVKQGAFSLESLVNWMSIKPAECFGLKGSELMIGSQADLAFFDLESEVIIPETFKSKSSNSPFIGEKVVGDAVMTMASGKIVWRK